MEVEYKTKYNSSYNLKMKTSIFVFSLKPLQKQWYTRNKIVLFALNFNVKGLINYIIIILYNIVNQTHVSISTSRRNNSNITENVRKGG